MYHSIGNNNYEYTINPEHFKRQIEYLIKRRFRILNSSDLIYILEKKLCRKVKQAVLLTFDDGYYNVILNALPVLEEYGLPAIVFVHTDRLSAYLGNELPLLTWQDIKTLSGKNVTIGNHSHSHRNLASLTPEQIWKEINESEKYFKEFLGIIPQTFAFPGGKYNKNILKILQEKDYVLAFSSDSGLVKENAAILQIPRISVTKNISFLEWKLSLTPAIDYYQFIKRVLSCR